MIQRIQSIYLLIITILTALTLFLPLGEVVIGSAGHIVTVFGLKSLPGTQDIAYSSFPLAGLTVLIAIVSFATIFLYKNRKRQILLSNINSFLIVCFYALFFYYVSTVKEQVAAMQYQMGIALAFPLIDLIFYYLVVRKIKADEALVRSLDRLR